MQAVIRAKIKIPNAGTNILGDVRGESDHRMLDQAFLETADYLSLVDSDDKIVVVGRRGTGKSAMTYRLGANWAKSKDSFTLLVAPQEHETIALRPYLSKFGSNFLHIRAGVRLACRYGILLEIASRLSTRYKIKSEVAASPRLAAHIREWGAGNATFLEKLGRLFNRHLSSNVEPELAIGRLAEALAIQDIESEFRDIFKKSGMSYVLIDRLDEGYEPDNLGVAFIDGVTNAAIDIAAAFRGIVRPIVFLRDNIFRAVAHLDQDFTRNIEAQTLRIHWDVQTLFYLVCNRIRAAFKDEQENNRRLWNRYTANDLQNNEGFKKCLQLTLYRPRDILILLNSAFHNAYKHQRDTLILDDLEISAKAVSANRLDDLRKEYRHIFPSIDAATATFANGNPELSISEVKTTLDALLSEPPKTNAVQLELAILQEPVELIRALYSVGFFGIHDSTTNTFVFCHDGKRPNRDFDHSEKLLIHPCYWMALNLSRNTLNPDEAEEINDEYEIKVASVTPAIRNSRLGKIMSAISRIPEGHSGYRDFEEWCLDASKICFAGKLENVQLHSNHADVNRRDIVATNLSDSKFWRRIREDYGSRQVIFEVKNYADLTQADYRQMLLYLSGNYGRVGFFISRAGVSVWSGERN